MINKDRRCKLWWCDEAHYSNGYCNPHYQLDRRTGTVFPENRKDVLAITERVELLASLLDEILTAHRIVMIEQDGYNSAADICLWCRRVKPRHEDACLIGRCEDALQGILEKYDKPVSLL